jgi:hypothetical protein
MNATAVDARRLALEGVVVVLSILVAFFLDAWAHGRELEHELNQELASVARELAENRELVVYEINALERIIAGSEAVVDLLSAQADNRLIPVPDTLAFLVAFWSPTLDASFGAVDALIASGRLSHITNPDLRAGLAGLKDQLEDGVDDELQAQIVLNEQVYPLVSREAEFGGVYRIDQAFSVQTRQSGRQLSSAQESVVFPNSFEVRNTILNRASWLGSGMGEMKRVLVQLDSLSSLIGQVVN